MIQTISSDTPKLFGPPIEKKCRVCGRIKPIEEFCAGYRRPTKFYDLYQTICKKCYILRYKIYYKDNQKRIVEGKTRRRNTKRGWCSSVFSSWNRFHSLNFDRDSFAAFMLNPNSEFHQWWDKYKQSEFNKNFRPSLYVSTNGSISLTDLKFQTLGYARSKRGKFWVHNAQKISGMRRHNVVTQKVVGKRFGRLLVISDDRRHKCGKFLYKCLCDCGKWHFTLAELLLKGKTTSCGCFAREQFSKRAKKLHTKTGLSMTPTYHAWRYILGKLKFPTNIVGKKIAPTWVGSKGFENFLKDMKQRPSDLYVFARKNPRKGFFKNNCLWKLK